MPKKSKKSDEYQQLSLLEAETENDSTAELSDDDWMSGDDSDFQETSNLKVEIQTAELLTLKLLQDAIKSENDGDLIMQEFSDNVLPNLLRVAVGVTAKGGKFFDYFDEKREEEIENYHKNNLGKSNKIKEPKKLDRRNAGDQSLNTHLLNGLLPANLIERCLNKLDTTAKRVIQQQERRLLIAGFILHDFEKFDYRLFPKMPDNYKAIGQDKEQDIRKLSIDAHREIIDVIVCELGLDKFVSPDEPTAWQEYRDDLLFIAYNAQRRNDTNLNVSEYGLHPIIDDYILICLADLTCLADLLSSVIKHPQDAEHQTLNGILHSLSDGQLKFTYHSIAENRGVLTNVVNNALIQAHTSLNTDEHTYYEPLLYLPTGVIYLASRNAPAISPEDLPDRVVNSIKSLCAGQLRLRQTGFGRDGKGMKYAEYYNLFFDDIGLMKVALDATLRILNPNKGSVAKSRSENLNKFQQQNVLSADYDFKFEDDIRIDQIAEFGDLVSRKIWEETVNRVDSARKKDKKLPAVPDFDLTHKVAEFWNLAEYLPQIREIQRINESLKENRLKGNTGGVPYEWYYLAAKYLEHHPGIEDVREACQQVIDYLTTLISPIISQYKLPDGWDDLRLWVKRVVMLPGTNQEPSVKAQVETFLNELDNYNAAKKSGRGKQLICSISHSAYTVTEQMESAVLFTPQVYTNKQMLGGSNAKRNISSIAGVEMMLRQILMNQTQAVGKRFEDGKYRYLYFYPTYYFTPETNKFLQKAYNGIAQTRFDTSVRNHFISKDLQANLGRDRYQSVDSFLIDENLQRDKDRTFKLSYPEDQPLTFYFMALPPGRDSTDTESWVMPTWLAFAFPMILDVKTVVSESPIPPFNDGAEFEESVFLDSAPHAFRALVRRDRFRLDYILEGWNENGIQYPAPLNVLTAAYAIHLDVNAKQGKSGYDANWGRFTELAKDFETSPLYVFSYLNRWVRNQGSETARIEKIRLYAYHFYPCFDPYVKYDTNMEQLIVGEVSSLNHPKKLTDLYRRFYRANKRYNPKSNAVLKPVDIAAETILKAESSVFQGETLVVAVAAEVFKLMDRVHSSTAEGRWIMSKREEERQAVLDFAKYFVVEVFDNAFAGDRARLAGRQLNLIRDTCEFLYRLEDDKENAGKNEKSAEIDNEND
ncbi:type I-D CRISPR-associated protein Cas10d/Csc3 [Nostoc sp. XA010]|uniref:type I-D CRISPR-associated protein Cas10d/Csc3 n=1 Tax=Nostoc sp. XA010 TaxID=2780407 RepID=UPI001E6451D5|nr:type I-D CRISPR-associated protein Cas10d/Csc3 [Nostoc sp. XA010]MCC5656394.1 type I-D CRISPR-associated protein Cas10d/Csc3 [Nostoc sp. XA010]